MAEIFSGDGYRPKTIIPSTIWSIPTTKSFTLSTNRINETESERCFVEDLHTFEKVLILQDKCSNDLPLFEPWLCKIRSEQKRALANQDTSLNNCTLDSQHKIVIPQSLVKDTLHLLHGLPQGGHPSKAKSLLRLKNSDYWWLNMLSDMTKYVQECPSCQKTAAVPKLHVPTTGTLWADRPFARVNVDVIGPLPEDQDDHRYILVFVDSFTRFTIIVPLKELNANLTSDALIWKVCAIFGIPFIVHSDNGPKFSKAVFDALCEILGIEVSKSVPHFSQSNGLVELRHRDILQNLRKLLVDCNAYDAWSEYIPYVQLLINSSKGSITGYSPYVLMFGSDFSPKADPGKIIETLESSTFESTYINDIQSKFARLKKKQEEAELHQASKAPPRDSQIEANPFSPGQLVKRASSSTTKLHGNYKGPFLVIDTPSPFTADIKNLGTDMVVKASLKHLQPWHSSLPADDEFHSWVAAVDAEQHVIQKVLSQDGDYCQVQWPGNHNTTDLVSTVQNTSAYKEFSNSMSNTRSRPSPRKRRSDNINNNVNPTPIRPRRSNRRKVNTVFNVGQTARISCIKEPLLKETLSLNNFGSNDRDDVSCDWVDNSEAVVEFVSCNVANDTLIQRRKLNHVGAFELKAKEKHRRNDNDIEDANAGRDRALDFIAFLLTYKRKTINRSRNLFE
ncbi:hypothetical protein P9112_006948 [Eukaryota sp. TZLM1-RC]